MYMHHFKRLSFPIGTTKQIKKDQIYLPIIAAQFKKHFQDQYKKYQIPLLSTDGLLSYTSRFAKTVINQQFNEDDRMGYYKLIKKSINTRKQFTLQSCVDICESLINFHFQGQENRILQKMRNYAKEHQKLLSSKQSDRFNRAHKYLMAERADGPIKFKDFKLDSPKSEKQVTQQTIRFILKRQKIANFRNDWSVKKELSFQLQINGVKRLIKFCGFQQNKQKKDQIEVLANKIFKLASKQNEILIINSSKPSQTISPQNLAAKLLNKFNLYYPLQQKSNLDDQTHIGKLINNLTKKEGISKGKIKVTSSNTTDYLNYILQHNNSDQLKQIFGYIKLNIFHTQFQKIMVSINKTKKTSVSQLQPISYLGSLEYQQRNLYNMISMDRFNAQAIINLFSTKEKKSLTIFCHEAKIVTLINQLFVLRKTPKPQQLIQNRKPAIATNKLIISSLIYQIPISLPSIQFSLNQYRKILHPITYKYHFN